MRPPTVIYHNLRTRRESVCRFNCGHRLLKAEVPLGTYYQVALFAATPGVLTCGGCGKKQSVMLVPVKPSGYIPIALFQEPVTPIIDVTPTKERIN